MKIAKSEHSSQQYQREIDEKTDKLCFIREIRTRSYSEIPREISGAFGKCITRRLNEYIHVQLEKVDT